MSMAIDTYDTDTSVGTQDGPTKYTVTPLPDGFTIERRDRVPVRVLLRGSYFEVTCPTRDDIGPKSFGLITFHEFMDDITRRLLWDWHPPEDRPPPTWDIHTWRRRKTARITCKPIHEQWQRLLRKVDPRVVAVHRAVFAATMRASSVTCDPEFYRDKYLVRDVLNHRAAAIAVASWESMVRTLRLRRFRASKEFAAAQQLAGRLGVNLWCDEPGVAADDVNFSWSDYLPDWQLMFSATGGKYRSLNRTLMNLPGGIPAGIVCRLNTVMLPRPITSRLELLTVLLVSATNRSSALGPFNPGAYCDNQPVFLKATGPQIKEGLRRVARATHNDWSPRRTRDVKYVVQYLVDYPDRHNGNIVGLTEKAIRWHRDQHGAEVEKILEQLGGDRETIRPPIPVPEVSGIRFLGTVEEICAEGIEMEHCIASYAHEAVSGHSYLFGVEREGERASVQVSAHSARVVQATGARNRQNATADWGRRVLTEWAKGLPKPTGGEIRESEVAIPF